MFKCCITENFNFKFFNFLVVTYCLYCLSFYLFDKVEGRTLAIRSVDFFWHRSLCMQGNLQIHLQLQLALSYENVFSKFSFFHGFLNLMSFSSDLHSLHG